MVHSRVGWSENESFMSMTHTSRDPIYEPLGLSLLVVKKGVPRVGCAPKKETVDLVWRRLPIITSDTRSVVER